MPNEQFDSHRTEDMMVGDFSTRTFIGVTGHREIKNPEEIRTAIDNAISEVQESVLQDSNQSNVPALLSALAEGADRLAADAIFDYADGELHAVLPLEPEDYMDTFESEEAKREFNNYLSRALTVTVGADRKEKPGVYFDVGKAIVDTCDILIAVWDGDSPAGKGGTGDIVQYARRHQKPLLRIDPANPHEPKPENLDALSISHHEEIDNFNNLRNGVGDIQNKCEKRLDEFMNTEEFDIGILKDMDEAHDLFSSTFQAYCPAFEAADHISLNNKHKFKLATILTYSFAALAVGVITVQTLFFPHHPEIVFLESFAMIGILLIIILGAAPRPYNLRNISDGIFSIFVLGTRNRWHENWLKYRTLSEKIRAYWYINLCVQSISGHVGPSPVQDRQFTNRWMTDILIDSWENIDEDILTCEVSVESAKRFTKKHWIEKQINYHEKKVEKSRFKNRLLSISGQIVFFITLIASVIHAGELIGHRYSPYILLLSFFLPSVGGAFGAIRLSRAYETEALRSERILGQLRELNSNLEHVENPDDLVRWAHEVENILEIEHHNWRNIHEGKPLELAA